jgi:serine/threonine protein kinase
MGQVYRAFDPRLHRDVAIKVARERVGERFDREVRTLAALNHPNICSVYDVGPDYLVMEPSRTMPPIRSSRRRFAPMLVPDVRLLLSIE